MEPLKLIFPENGMIALSIEESKLINGGVWVLFPPLLAIGAIAAAMAIFELVKATGDFLYHVTH